MKPPHPVVALLACGVAAITGATGWIGAGLSVAALAVCAVLWGLPVRSLWRRFAFAALGLSGFLVFVPWTGWHSADLVVRGLAVTSSCLVLGASASWSSLLAFAQRLGLPRALVAFLAILACHVGAVREEVLRVHRALALRGGYRTWANRARSWRILLVRLLPEVIRRADRTADALALRGFRGILPGEPSRPLQFEDLVSVGISLALVIVGVVL